jgi:hypothetical protein
MEWPKGLQWVCMGVGCGQLCLLLWAYFSEARGVEAYVSQELERESTFKLLMTMSVMMQV